MKKILILCLLSISFSQQFDYSKMSDADKIMLYSEMKLEPINIMGLNAVIPAYGFVLLKNEENSLLRKGIIINLVKLGMLVYYDDFNYRAENSNRHYSDCIKQAESKNDCNDGDKYWASMYTWYSDISLTLFLATSLLESYYIFTKVQKHNNKLYKNIFGKEPPNIKASLYPLHDGAGITFTYSFN